MNAVAGGILEMLHHLGSIDQKLLGHTAANHAGSTHTIAFDDGDLGAVARRPLGCRQTTGASTDHHEIKRLLHRNAHQSLLILRAMRSLSGSVHA